MVRSPCVAGAVIRQAMTDGDAVVSGVDIRIAEKEDPATRMPTDGRLVEIIPGECGRPTG